jgi:hypothetical protein
MVKNNVKLIGYSVFLIFGLAACASTNAPPTYVDDEAEITTPYVPAPAPPPKPPKPKYAPVNDDLCGAKPLQYLVGRPRTEIPVPLEPSKRRVLCTSCAATQDYNPNRQNIIFDAETGIIKSVNCG